MTRRWVGPLVVAVVVACGSKLFTIDVEGESETVVEQGTLLEDLVGDLGFDDFLDMNVVETEELQNQGVEPGDIEDVRLVDFVLVATEPAGADLSFLAEMALFVEANGLERKRVAFQDQFPEGVAEVAFELDDVDLTPYAVSESMSLTVDVTGHRPEDDTTVVARYVLAVGVTSQGCANQACRGGE